jgi:glycosyltransferase involved in cell wall biosynthesis
VANFAAGSLSGRRARRARGMSVSHPPTISPGAATSRPLRGRLRGPTCIAATCSELQAALARELVVNINRIDVIPTCLNLRNYFTIKPRNRVRAISHVGTAAYKNAAATIEAFSRIGADDVRLLIVGLRDAALERSLARLSLGLQSRVVCCGRVSAEEFIALASSVRIVSVPSLYRVAVASPTVLEAFACGTPVVGSDSISRDILDNGVNGYRCNAGDVEAIAGCFE